MASFFVFLALSILLYGLFKGADLIYAYIGRTRFKWFCKFSGSKALIFVGLLAFELFAIRLHGELIAGVPPESTRQEQPVGAQDKPVKQLPAKIGIHV